ncbi:MAG: hypothetical protein FWH57_05080 [Oscillospiraceae bacterium]|nr:hypothetical protein [Oscillospiraceae bacterium]MCL2152318.1 hypothetical protein [Oscillospiraceae bacterium]
MIAFIKSKRGIIVVSCCVAVLAAAIVLSAVFLWRVDQAKYSLSYVVTADPSYGELIIDMAVDIKSLPEDRTLLFYMGKTDAIWYDCLDGNGEEVPYYENGDLMVIGPVEKKTRKLNFKYEARIGALSDIFDSMPYTQGSFFDDLLTFSGEYVFLLPYTDPDLLDSMDKYIKSVSIDFQVPDDWQSIIPYNKPLDGSRSLYVNKPTWDFFNSISKSAFCFGHFERFDYGGTLTSEQIYVDVAAADGIPQYTIDTLTLYLDYFTEIFGQTLDDVPIVLLRNHPYDYSIIVGGVGSRCSAVSMDMRFIDDYKVLSNVVYHSFFDSKIKPRNLRYVTGNWIYVGLADYYVNLSSGLLPIEVRNNYEMGQLETFEEKYLKYLYFSLKEPGFLGLNPADEQLGMYQAQQDYYFGVKVPIIIDAINYLIDQKTGRPDGFIKSLVEIGASEKSIDLDDLLKMVCGDDYETIKMYFAGYALIPNYKTLNIDYMPREDIIDILDLTESAFAAMFRLDNVYYPYASVVLLNEEPFMAEVQRRGVRYNSDEIQEEVKKFSAVLHRLLLQYAFWAKIAGIDDITEPGIHEAMFDQSAIYEWDIFCDEIGFEIDII